MADGGNDATSTVSVASSKASETLSQFLARILQQLALSAWLPSAALVGLTAFVLRLGLVLDARGQAASPGPADAIGKTFDALAHTNVGGALISVGGVVIGTILTQAFSFEAIRLLEGYWGTNRWVERVAWRRCRHYRRLRHRLDERYDSLTRQAWREARQRIESVEGGRMLRGQAPRLTSEMIDALQVTVIGGRNVRLTPAQLTTLRAYDWQQHAPDDLLRRRVNVGKRRQDFPRPRRVLPTHLGNVLRKFEDDTGWRSPESRVQELFDDLPFSLKVEHDEQRTRLDLYCSVVVVTGAVTMLAVARFAEQHPGYSAAAATVGLVTMWLMYRAAIASARAYGRLLVTISRWDQARRTSARRQPAVGAASSDASIASGSVPPVATPGA